MEGILQEEDLQTRSADEGAQKAREEVADIRRRMAELERRDFTLWALGTLVLWLLAAGLIVPLLPLFVPLANFPQVADWSPFELALGFLGVTLIFNAHALWQRRVLRLTRQMLVEQFGRAQAAEQLAILDPLTRAYNRRYLDEVIRREMRRAARLKNEISFLMIDLDDFRGVNNEIGHPAADRLLCAVAELLQATVRYSDSVVRYGGDEFLVVLPDTSRADADSAVERIRQAAEKWNRQYAQDAFRISFSCGIASYHDGDDLTAVLARADRNMYENKARRESSLP